MASLQDDLHSHIWLQAKNSAQSPALLCSWGILVTVLFPSGSSAGAARSHMARRASADEAPNLPPWWTGFSEQLWVWMETGTLPLLPHGLQGNIPCVYTTGPSGSCFCVTDHHNLLFLAQDTERWMKLIWEMAPPCCNGDNSSVSFSKADCVSTCTQTHLTAPCLRISQLHQHLRGTFYFLFLIDFHFLWYSFSDVYL